MFQFTFFKHVKQSFGQWQYSSVWWKKCASKTEYCTNNAAARMVFSTNISSRCLENKDPTKRRLKTWKIKTCKNKTQNTAIFPNNIKSCYRGSRSTVHWTKQTLACVAGGISKWLLFEKSVFSPWVNLKSRLPQFLDILNSPQPG